MKKILVAVAAFVAFSFGASAQETKEAKPAQQQPAAQQHHEQKEKKDEISFKDGKVTQTVNGQQTAVEKDITLKNGAIVSPNGTVKNPDGTTVALKEGDVINHEGKVWNKKEGKEAKEGKVMKGEVK